MIVGLEGEYGEIVTVPGSVAKKIVRTLQLPLSPDEKKRLQKDVATDRSAYELYLKAIALEHSTAADWVSRIHLLEQARSRHEAFKERFAHWQRE